MAVAVVLMVKATSGTAKEEVADLDGAVARAVRLNHQLSLANSRQQSRVMARWRTVQLCQRELKYR